MEKMIQITLSDTKKRKKKKEKIIITIVCLNFKNPRIRGYIKHFSDAKSMSFLIEDKKLQLRNKEI